MGRYHGAELRVGWSWLHRTALRTPIHRITRCSIFFDLLGSFVKHFAVSLLVLGSLMLGGCQEFLTSKSSANRPIRIDKSDQSSSAESNSDPDPAVMSSWPNLFGPNRQSQIRDPNVPSRIASLPREIWRIDIGTGYSAPVIQGDRLFISHRLADDEIIECFSVQDGSSLWSYSFPAPYECAYEYSCGPYSTPLLFNDRIIVVGQAGHTFCLQQADGSLIWNRDLFGDYQMELGEWPVAAGGIVVGDRFIFNLGAVEKQAGIIALDVNTGQTVWESTRQEAGHATPNLMTVAGKQYVIMVTSNGLVSIDPESGLECWSIPFRRRKAETYNAVSPVVMDDLVCMVTGPGPGTLLVRVSDTNEPEVVWEDRRILDSQYTNLLGIDGFLFGFTPMKQGGPELRCIDLLQKKLAWKWKADLGRAMILAVNETILILGEKGNFAGIALSTDGVDELFRTEAPLLKGPCYSAPAYAAGKIFLRNEQHVVCLEVPVNSGN